MSDKVEDEMSEEKIERYEKSLLGVLKSNLQISQVLEKVYECLLRPSSGRRRIGQEWESPCTNHFNAVNGKVKRI